MATTDLLGWGAALLTLLTFASADALRLRVLALTANVAFAAYGQAAVLLPVLALHLLLIPINAWRLVDVIRRRQRLAALRTGPVGPAEPVPPGGSTRSVAGTAPTLSASAIARTSRRRPGRSAWACTAACPHRTRRAPSPRGTPCPDCGARPDQRRRCAGRAPPKASSCCRHCRGRCAPKAAPQPPTRS